MTQKQNEIKNRCINVLIPLMKRNGISIYDLEEEIKFREEHKNELISARNEYLRLYFTEELIHAKRFWKEC